MNLFLDWEYTTFSVTIFSQIASKFFQKMLRWLVLPYSRKWSSLHSLHFLIENTQLLLYINFECKFLVKGRGSYSIEFTISTILIVHQLLWIKINRDNKWWGERGGGKKEECRKFFWPKEWKKLWWLRKNVRFIKIKIKTKGREWV